MKKSVLIVALCLLAAILIPCWAQADAIPLFTPGGAQLDGKILGASATFTPGGTLEYCDRPPSVPEPGTLSLLGSGLVLLARIRGRRTR